MVSEITAATASYLDHPVLAAIRDRAEEFAAEEQESVQERRLSDRTVELLREIGVMRVLQPARYGGLEADPRVFNEACWELGRIAPCAGWVLGVIGVHHWNIALYHDDVQRQVWGEDPGVWVSASYGPAGRATRVDGGFRLTGRWGFSSGSDHCRWAFVGGLSDEGGPGPTYRYYLVSRDAGEYEVDVMWDAAGLTGTGSHDLVCTDAFVPEERAMDVGELFAQRVPGSDVNQGPLFRIPWYTLFLNSVVMPMVGMARAAVDETAAIHRDRVAADPMKMPAPATLTRLAGADAHADLARLALQHNLGGVWQAALDDQPLSMAERQRAKRDHITAVELTLSAVDGAYKCAGPRAVYRTNRVQQLWRDCHAGGHHAMNLPEGPWGEYGRWLVDGTPTGLI